MSAVAEKTLLDHAHEYIFGSSSGPEDVAGEAAGIGGEEEQPVVAKLQFGRVVEVSSGESREKDLEWLSPSAQPFPFIIGHETLEQLQHLRGVEMLRKVGGYSDEVIQEKRKEGISFWLVRFMVDAHDPSPVRATWDNVLELVERVSPACHAKLVPIWEDLKVLPTEHYTESNIFGGQETAVLLFWTEKKKLQDSNPELFAKVQSFEAFASAPLAETVNEQIIEGRAFLRHTLMLSELFRGDGFAYDTFGNQGMAEYLFPRTKLADLQLSEDDIEDSVVDGGEHKGEGEVVEHLEAESVAGCIQIYPPKNDRGFLTTSQGGCDASCVTNLFPTI